MNVRGVNIEMVSNIWLQKYGYVNINMWSMQKTKIFVNKTILLLRIVTLLWHMFPLFVFFFQ